MSVSVLKSNFCHYCWSHQTSISVAGSVRHLLLRQKNIRTGMVWHAGTGLGEYSTLPSVLGHCWLGDRKGIPPVKLLSVAIWMSVIWRAVHVSELRFASPPSPSLTLH